nr:MAG TPA: hypothetical protein [Caudoviricetes sp.]
MFSLYVRRRNNAAFNVLRIVWTKRKPPRIRNGL